MISQTDGNAIAEHSARMLAESDPMAAARALAEGLRVQSSGGRAAVLRYLVEAVVLADRKNLAPILADLQGIATRLGKGHVI